VDEVLIREAIADERLELEELQWRASLVWEDDREMLLANPDAISLPADQLEDRLVRVAVDGNSRRLGFSVLFAMHEGGCELDGLFVEPDSWHAGIGRALVGDCCERARRQGAARIDVIANARAEGFYVKVGFVFGETVSTRFRPARRMHLMLDGGGPSPAVPAATSTPDSPAAGSPDHR